MRKYAVFKLLWHFTVEPYTERQWMWSGTVVYQAGRKLKEESRMGWMCIWLISQGCCSIMPLFPFQMLREAILCRKPLGKKAVYSSSQFWALFHHGWQGSHRGWRVEQLITSIAQTREKEWIHAAYLAHFAYSYSLWLKSQKRCIFHELGLPHINECHQDNLPQTCSQAKWSKHLLI